MDTPPSVSVITLTRRRIDLLPRAVRTVAAQTGVRLLEHLVLVDDCLATRDRLAAAEWLPAHVRWSFHPRSAGDRTGPARVAALRTHGARLSRGTCVAFLDDDNEWEPDHLATLVACMRDSGCAAVHSHLTIHWPDGRPYLEPRLPWARDPSTAAAKYEALVSAGVWTPGSHVVRDRVDPAGSPDPIRSVDMGAWLFSTRLIQTVGFRAEYDARDWAEVTTEDDKLLDDLVAGGVAVACTNRPTLRYFVGGYSNRQTASPDEWQEA